MTSTRWMGRAAAAVYVIGVSSLPSLADACHGQMMHGQMHGGHEQSEADDHSAHYLKHLLKHAEEIGLTPEQVGKLKALLLDFKRTEARTEADIKIADLELRALVGDDQADLPAIKAKVNQLKYVEGVLMLAAIKAKRDGMALLTPEQREKDRARHEQMKHEGEAQHGGGMGGMGAGGRGGMMSGGHGGQGSGDHGSGDASGGQQHQH